MHMLCGVYIVHAAHLDAVHVCVTHMHMYIEYRCRVALASTQSTVRETKY